MAQLRGRQHIGQLIDQIPGGADALRQDQPLVQRRLNIAVCQQGHGTVTGRLLLGEVVVKCILAEGKGAGDLTQELVLPGKSHLVQPIHQDGPGLELVQGRTQTGRRGPEVIEGGGAAAVEAHQQHGGKPAAERQPQGAALPVLQGQVVALVHRQIGLLQRWVRKGHRRIGGEKADHRLRAARGSVCSGKIHGAALISKKMVFPYYKGCGGKRKPFFTVKDVPAAQFPDVDI